MKPQLFTDVDGCLLVDSAIPGYRRFEHDGTAYWYDPRTPANMKRLAELFEVVWTSKGWRGKEDDVLSPLFGVPRDLEQFSFVPAGQAKPGVMYPEKLDEIEREFGGVAAVLDDRIGPAAEKWAKSRLCLLIQPNAAVGMTEAQYNLLCSFGEQFSEVAPASKCGKLVADFLEQRKSAEGRA